MNYKSLKKIVVMDIYFYCKRLLISLIFCVVLIIGNQAVAQSTPQGSGPYMFLQNMDLIPANDVLVMSLIQEPWRRTSPDTTPYNANHDRVILRVHNDGTGTLNVTNLILSNTVSWKI